MLIRVLKEAQGIDDLDILGIFLVILTSKYVFIKHPELTRIPTNSVFYEFLFPDISSAISPVHEQNVVWKLRFWNPKTDQRYIDEPLLIDGELRKYILEIRRHYCAVRHRFIQERQGCHVSWLPPSPFFSDINFIKSILVKKSVSVKPLVCPTYPLCDRTRCPYPLQSSMTDMLQLEDIRYIGQEDILPRSPHPLSPHLSLSPSVSFDTKRLVQGLRVPLKKVGTDQFSLSCDGETFSPLSPLLHDGGLFSPLSQRDESLSPPPPLGDGIAFSSSSRLAPIPREQRDRQSSIHRELHDRQSSGTRSFGNLDKNSLSTSFGGVEKTMSSTSVDVFHKSSFDKRAKDSPNPPPSMPPCQKIAPVEISTPIVPFSKPKFASLVQLPGHTQHQRLTSQVLRSKHAAHLHLTTMAPIIPMFDTSELPVNDVSQFIKEILSDLKLKDIFAYSIEIPDTWISIKRTVNDPEADAKGEDSTDDDSIYVYKCMYNLERRLFYVLILDTDEPSEEQRGASKHVTTNNFFFMINASLPLWPYLVPCDGDFRVARGWRVAAMTSSSPAFQRMDGNRVQLLQLIRELQADGFVACPVGDDSNIAAFIAPFKGTSLAEMRGVVGSPVKNFMFLENLVKFLLMEIEKDFNRYDLKPHNILYDDISDNFCWIDYKQTKPTLAFLLPHCPRQDISRLAAAEQNFIKVCLAPLANCLVNTVRYLLSEDNEIFSDNALVPTIEFWEMFWHKFALHTRSETFYLLLRESIDCIHEKLANFQAQQSSLVGRRQSSSSSSSSSSASSSASAVSSPSHPTVL